MLRFQKSIPFSGVVWFLLTAQAIPQQYHFINQSLIWSEAQSYCRLKFTDLATVRNMVDNNDLLASLDGLDTRSWIGLTRAKLKSWKWSDGSGKLMFSNWNPGEPNNIAWNENCVIMASYGKWYDVGCHKLKSYICTEYGEDGRRRYVYYSTARSYFESQDDCRNRDGGMPIIRNELENSNIASAAEGRTTWIGLHRDQWMWSDGSETSFRYWLRHSSASGNCVAVSMPNQGFWILSDCNNRATFICGGGQKLKKTVIRIKVHTVVDLTNLPVSGEILKQLETHLRNQGVTDVNLCWNNYQDQLVFRRNEQEVKSAEC